MVLTKLDGDARGGAALSVAAVTGRPVMFASNGEKLEDFDVFHPDRMASRILGMGDVLTLIEQAQQDFDAEQTEKMAGQVRLRRRLHPRGLPRSRCRPSASMGSLRRCSACCPAWANMREQLDNLDDRDIDRVAGDHPVDDAGRAPPTRRSSTAPAGPGSPAAPA